MIPIRPVPQRYAWGSPDRLQRMFPAERRVSGPLAELWYSGHGRAPSTVTLDGQRTPLTQAIRSDPARMVGPVASHLWGPVLPYLLKVIAVRIPLSLQVHPVDFEARAGFHRENAAGIPLDAPERSFRDAVGKFEMVMALDPFDASVGFAPVARQIMALGAVRHPLADRMRGLLEGSAWMADWATDYSADRLDHVMDHVADRGMGHGMDLGTDNIYECDADAAMPDSARAWPESRRRVFRAFHAAIGNGFGGVGGDGCVGTGVGTGTGVGIGTDVGTGAGTGIGAGTSVGTGTDWAALIEDGMTRIPAGEEDVRRAFANALRAARAFPGDPAALCLLMMNAVHLRPGQAAAIAPGTPHAYIHGTAVEIMTNSDNVLRAGLTVKHRNVRDLLHSVRTVPEPACAPTTRPWAHGTLYLPGPDELALATGFAVDARGGAGPSEIFAARPRVVVCLDGVVECVGAHESMTLHAGDAAFIPAADGPVTFHATGATHPDRPTYLITSTAV